MGTWSDGDGAARSADSEHGAAESDARVGGVEQVEAGGGGSDEHTELSGGARSPGAAPDGHERSELLSNDGSTGHGNRARDWQRATLRDLRTTVRMGYEMTCMFWRRTVHIRQG